MKVTTSGIDVAKSVFQVHGVDEGGKVVLRRQIRRAQLLLFFSRLAPCLIGMEACASSHYWARKLSALGHTVRLMAPQFVKPYRKNDKNDGNDAEAICEAVQRPSMRFVPVKSPAQQAELAVHRIRRRLVGQRTALINQLRGLIAEYGVVLPQGANHVRSKLPALLEDCSESLPTLAVEGASNAYTAAIPSASGLGSSTASARSPPPPSWRRLHMPPSSKTAASAPPGWAWCPNRIPPAASPGCLVSVSAAMSTCEHCWCMAPALQCAIRQSATIRRAAGSSSFVSAAARTSPPWHWPPSTHASSGR